MSQSAERPTTAPPSAATTAGGTAPPDTPGARTTVAVVGTGRIVEEHLAALGRSADVRLVVVEPAALSAASLRELLAHARAGGATVVEGHGYRFDVPLRRLAPVLAAGVPRPVVRSSSVYDHERPAAGSVVDDSSPPDVDGHGRDAYAQTKVVQEQVVRERLAGTARGLVVLRPGVVHGDEPTWTYRVGRAIGRLWLALGSCAQVPLVHVADCARAMVLAAAAADRSARPRRLPGFLVPSSLSVRAEPLRHDGSALRAVGWVSRHRWDAPAPGAGDGRPAGVLP